MPREALTDRVERLEKTVEALQTLPAEVAALGERVGAVEVQVSQLRTEMHTEFSAMRSELAVGTEVQAEFAAVRGEMRTEFAAVQGEFATVRSEMQTGFADVKNELREEIRVEITAVRTEMREDFAAARDEMLAGFAIVTSELGRQIRESAEEGKRHSATLFEEALSRIAILSEHREGSPLRKPRTPRSRR